MARQVDFLQNAVRTVANTPQEAAAPQIKIITGSGGAGLPPHPTLPMVPKCVRLFGCCLVLCVLLPPSDALVSNPFICPYLNPRYPAGAVVKCATMGISLDLT